MPDAYSKQKYVVVTTWPDGTVNKTQPTPIPHPSRELATLEMNAAELGSPARYKIVEVK